MQYSMGGSFIRRDGDTVPGAMVWEGTQKWEANVTLANAVNIRALDASAGAHLMAGVTTGNKMRFGDTSIPVEIYNNASLTNGATAKIASATSGVYTGDGATSLAVTGLAFFPSYVKIWEPGADTEAIETFETTKEIIDDDGAGLSFVQNYTGTGAQARLKHNSIITLAEGSFTVDDDGTDAHPNKASTVYNYFVLGL